MSLQERLFVTDMFLPVPCQEPDLCMCSSHTSCENDEDSNIERQDHDSDDNATNDD